MNNQDIFKELDSLTGLRNVKHEIHEDVKEILLRKQAGTIPATRNYAFIGNPGTGKSTVAGIFGRILKDIGVLSGGQVVTVTRADLVGSYLGASEQKTRQAENAYYDELVKQIVDGSKVEVNSTIIANEAAANEEQLKKQVESNGLTFEQYLEITGQKADELKDKMQEEAGKNVKGYLVMQTLAAKEHLLVDDAELDHELAKTAERYQMKVEDLKKAYGDNLNSFRTNLVNKKIHDYIVANND